ncbi:hypothetical protein L228DRAFT_240047 [Xylona heveae TC161]|uniref:Uncharacterized protein n=1 Tax=Xylona heveae (strain CBS 132557 / TC161) TaxID=1328760 RepID=A0A165FMW2_XYLHT|nr:hypothetical protein L228DRAFT_240047 [Xylona heveae TC161]KZF21170.1 hypothetical protein L228DRAFT_240047 [Xylona heveae TC161]
MPWKAAIAELSEAVRSHVESITNNLTESFATKNNVVHTKDLRIDVHGDPKHPTKAVARIQENAQAKDHAVKDFIRTGNKGDGHKGTHKIIAEIPFDRENFDVDDFISKIENARK